MRWMALLLLAIGVAVPVAAHEVRPAALTVRETGPGRYDVDFRVPAVEDRYLGLRPEFSSACRGWQNAQPIVHGAAATARYRMVCAQPLAGTAMRIVNLNRTMIDTIVRIEFANGQVVTERLQPTRIAFTIPARTSAGAVFRSYLALGVEHILFGIDHLLFVFALVLLVGRWRSLLATATAFTAAHSITLSLAALGVVHVPVPPVEALIALSILYVAVELVRRVRDPSAPAPRPWLLAFAFGLLHGLGFASALAEIGLPNHEIPTALLAFNIGVELGQIAFIAALLAIRAVGARLAPRIGRPAFWAATYAIGGLSSFWVIQRVATF